MPRAPSGPRAASRPARRRNAAAPASDPRTPVRTAARGAGFSIAASRGAAAPGSVSIAPSLRRSIAGNCNNPPVISIVTSTLNAAADLPHTLRSIAAQRGASFEWIVVDGGSTDGTLELLRQHQALV